MLTMKPYNINSSGGSARWVFVLSLAMDADILTKSPMLKRDERKNETMEMLKNERKRVQMISDCQGPNPAVKQSLIVKVQIFTAQAKNYMSVQPSHFLV